jgi:uncharacterized protein (DUF305 family)
LTVVVLLSLGKESTQREYKIAFAENAIDEHAEAVKVATAAKKSILVLYVLEVTRQCSPAYWQQQKYNKTKSPKQRAKGFYINQAVSQR